MESTPLVSVIMPVYNCGDNLSEAINSVLEQTFDRFELVIIYDKSTDNSLQQIKSFKNSKIKLIINKTKGTIVSALNQGIIASEGKYIARMDGDDIYHLNRLKLNICSWKKIPKLGYVVVGQKV